MIMIIISSSMIIMIIIVVVVVGGGGGGSVVSTTTTTTTTNNNNNNNNNTNNNNNNFPDCYLGVCFFCLSTRRRHLQIRKDDHVFTCTAYTIDVPQDRIPIAVNLGNVRMD